MHEKTFVGIDCGQSHLSVTVVTKEGCTLCHGVGGPSHIQGAPMDETFRRGLEEALTTIPEELIKQVLAVGAGVTGIGIPGKREAITNILSQVFPNASIYLTNDAVTAHHGASGGRDGVTVLAGTGSIARGKFGNKEMSLGGFGYLFGDEGGGIWIGLRAIRRALRAYEARDTLTSLCDSLPKYFGLDNVRKIPGHIYSNSSVDVQKIAGLSKIVANEAAQGDVVACEVLTEAGNELSALTIQLLASLNVPKELPFPGYRLGGVWNAGANLDNEFISRVSYHYPNIHWREPIGDPGYGAAIYAQACLEEIENGG